MSKYIDEDKLLYFINNNIGTNILSLYEILLIIKKQPAVDVEPVRHGKYIVDGWDGIYAGVGICSICNGTMMYGSKYCPRCGAKMDLEG